MSNESYLNLNGCHEFIDFHRKSSNLNLNADFIRLVFVLIESKKMILLEIQNDLEIC